MNRAESRRFEKIQADLSEAQAREKELRAELGRHRRAADEARLALTPLREASERMEAALREFTKRLSGADEILRCQGDYDGGPDPDRD